ncbi:hypothetical protein RchiOBHm_Chr2g0085521 [Rosa chinensis]|uniref:Uncharacterized protein n=1 Tax=Rosa chinensis TaxID=74649 RepID=A0A2P6RI77_ROSCH|nr:uncharacterized protein LOC112185448 [Rosa chinensis]PRQ46107.1 hypothetical protein RchiOBHm_Chr2g0085521 [Rosa chinensis]
MKKMKGVVAVEPSSYALYQDSKARFKHQSLMQDYEELQKEAEAMKNRLEMMKQKKSILTAEVRFLRRRYKYLIGKQSMNPKPKQDLVQTHNLKIQRTDVLKGKNYSKKESALRHPAPAMDLNQRVRIKNAMEVALQKSTPNSDLNHKARTVSRKETTLHNSNPVIDLNQKEKIQSGKESTKRKNTPVFDLNQVSLEEEEEIQADCEPLRTDEPNKSILRGGIDEQHNDIKLLVCRTIGNGSNRSGKRKISWQDPVALRV